MLHRGCGDWLRDGEHVSREHKLGCYDPEVHVHAPGLKLEKLLLLPPKLCNSIKREERGDEREQKSLRKGRLVKSKHEGPRQGIPSSP